MPVGRPPTAAKAWSSLAELAAETEYHFVEERPLGLSLSDRDENGVLFANGQVVVWQVHEGEAAHELGVPEKSVLCDVNGLSVAGMSAEQVSAFIRALGRPLILRTRLPHPTEDLAI